MRALPPNLRRGTAGAAGAGPSETTLTRRQPLYAGTDQRAAGNCPLQQCRMPSNHIHHRPTARQFHAFAQAVGDEIPLYSRLSEAIVGDEELLELAGSAMPGQPPPNLLFAAAQYLITGGTPHELVAWYPAISGAAAPETDPFPVFQDFCRVNREELQQLIRTRRTQTNEVARCLALVPALATVASRVADPMALIEVGASAGLMLAFDRYHYLYGSQTWGHRDSTVSLTTELRGAQPTLPIGALQVAGRVGIDLYPVDVTSESDVRWLDALVWPGHEERRTRLGNAVAAVALDPPVLLAGDALELLPGMIAAVDDGVVPVVFPSFALIQWSSEQRAELDRLLSRQTRPIMRIWLEWFGYKRNLPAVKLYEYRDGEVQVKTLGRFHHHGRWLDWGWQDPTDS
jgi:hypothetical protein